MPKFSIVISVYNIEKYLNECIDSVLGQSFTDFELILVDDGSPDNCPAVCDEYASKDSRVRVIHKKNAGPSAARNTGLDAATGEYIWFVDGDDYLLPGALQTAAQSTANSPDIVNFCNICFYDYKPDVEQGRRLYSYVGEADKKQICDIFTHSCTQDLLPYAWRNIYRTAFLKDNSIRFNESLRYSEDSVFNSEAFLKADKMIFSDKNVYAYRYRKDSLSKKPFNKKLIESLELYDRLRDENYQKYCAFPNDEYYKDAGCFMIKTVYFYSVIYKLYKSAEKHKYRCFKKASKSEMIKKAFERFDINSIKSKSLEWYIFYFSKHKLYFLAHILCKMIIK